MNMRTFLLWMRTELNSKQKILHAYKRFTLNLDKSRSCGPFCVCSKAFRHALHHTVDKKKQFYRKAQKIKCVPKLILALQQVLQTAYQNNHQPYIIFSELMKHLCHKGKADLISNNILMSVHTCLRPGDGALVHRYSLTHVVKGLQRNHIVRAWV